MEGQEDCTGRLGKTRPWWCVCSTDPHKPTAGLYGAPGTRQFQAVRLGVLLSCSSPPSVRKITDEMRRSLAKLFCPPCPPNRGVRWYRTPVGRDLPVAGSISHAEKEKVPMPKSSSIRGNAVHALLPTTLIVISLVLLLVTLTPSLRAQTFTVLHDFTGGDDGGSPWSGLTPGPQGSFYGTTWSGGQRSSDCVDSGCGTLFQLSKGPSGWNYSVIHTFLGSDGAGPWARVVFGPNGALFGTTSAGGVGGGGCQVQGDHLGCGTVFKMVPPNPVGPNTKNHGAPMPLTTVYTFLNGDDGAVPGFGDLIFDPAGNIYGTTVFGGWSGWGAVYEISASGQGWTERGLYGFSDGADGGEPYAGVLRDAQGNLYGGTIMGGDPSCWSGACGVLYQLVPSAGSWTYNTIFTFHDMWGEREQVRLAV